MFAPINLASSIYVLAAGLAVALIVWPWLQRQSLVWLVLGSIPAVLAIKYWRGYHLFGEALPLTVTEVCAVAVTVILACQLGRGLEEFRTAVASMMLGYLHDRSVPFKTGQSEIYREIRRARVHHRPLALLAVAPDTASVDLSLDKFLREVQRETVRQYVTARIADFLSMEMKDCDIITQRGGHFILLLPETGHAQVKQIVNRLERVVEERLGLELKVGSAVFPDEGSTFVMLLEQAEEALDRASRPESDDEPVARPTNGLAAVGGNGHSAANGNGHSPANGNGHHKPR
jgi:GGDEF domain-containing protein